MAAWIRRLYRSWANPQPQEGQYWTLDGLGRVFLVRKHVHTTYINKTPMANTITFTVRTHDGSTHNWSDENVRLQGNLWHPTSLAEVGQPPPKL